MKLATMICVLATLPMVFPAWGAKVTSKVKKANVFFVSPKNGDTVSTKFTVKFGVQGSKIRPAGEDANDKAFGHHHVIIDGLAIAEGHPVPTDDRHKHFGKGQSETELELAPGVHSLTLQFADGAHLSYGPKMSQTINIVVQ